ncbi:hypothetical protein EII20_09805 [Comamonadaceae bacterium OH2545_COT-014]|nr:hypothetical protein EII20_09805 [Comamonadaceae bacterium OH2545_COT-014]
MFKRVFQSVVLVLVLGLPPLAAMASSASEDEGMDAPDDPAPPPLPRSPLEGTFQLVRTVPEIGMDENEYRQDFFFPGQKVHFKYLGDMGRGDGIWEGQQAYVMTLYPPFPVAMCRQERWGAYCRNNGTYVPYKEVQTQVNLSTDPLDEEQTQLLAPMLKPLGLGFGQHSYTLAFGDRIGAFGLHFHDRDTLIVDSYHPVHTPGNSKYRSIKVIQVFKRVAPESHGAAPAAHGSGLRRP